MIKQVGINIEAVKNGWIVSENPSSRNAGRDRLLAVFNDICDLNNWLLDFYCIDTEVEFDMGDK